MVLTEKDLLQIKHVSGDENVADLFINNLPELAYEQMYCEIERYGKQGKVLNVTQKIILDQEMVLAGVSSPCQGALWINHRAMIHGLMWSVMEQHKMV